MRKTKLGIAVKQIVQLALASSVGASAYACSVGGPDPSDAGQEDGPTPAFADEATFACDAPLPALLADLTPGTPVDYVELRIQRYLDDGGRDEWTTAESQGTPCASATDTEACNAKLAGAAPPSIQHGWRFTGDHIGLYQEPERQVLVVTRGDEVTVLSTMDEVRSFLGPIDTFAEARLLLLTGNNPLECTPAGRSGWRKNEDGSFEFLLAGRECNGHMTYRRRYRVTAEGDVTLLASDKGQSTAKCGRRPDGLAEPALEGRGVGAFFAQVAHLEAASVIAFRRLEQELERLGAPAGLVGRARRARRDEIRHAAETGKLARRFGSETPRVDVAPLVDRTAFAIALENAVEGCVGETYGALVAAFQAERASPELRPVLRRIAQDEAAHAELAHDIARWLEQLLNPAERAAVERARRRALAELREAIRQEPDEDVVRIAGAPSSDEARVLLDGLEGLLTVAA